MTPCCYRDWRNLGTSPAGHSPLPRQSPRPRPPARSRSSPLPAAPRPAGLAGGHRAAVAGLPAEPGAAERRVPAGGAREAGGGCPLSLLGETGRVIHRQPQRQPRSDAGSTARRSPSGPLPPPAAQTPLPETQPTIPFPSPSLIPPDGAGGRAGKGRAATFSSVTAAAKGEGKRGGCRAAKRKRKKPPRVRPAVPRLIRQQPRSVRPPGSGGTDAATRRCRPVPSRPVQPAAPGAPPPPAPAVARHGTTRHGAARHGAAGIALARERGGRAGTGDSSRRTPRRTRSPRKLPARAAALRHVPSGVCGKKPSSAGRKEPPRGKAALPRTNGNKRQE